MRSIDDIQNEIEEVYQVIYSDDELVRLESDLKLSYLIAELEGYSCHG